MPGSDLRGGSSTLQHSPRAGAVCADGRVDRTTVSSDELEPGIESSTDPSGARARRDGSQLDFSGSARGPVVPPPGGSAAGRPGRVPEVDSRTCDSKSGDRRRRGRWSWILAVGHPSTAGRDVGTPRCGASPDHGHARSSTGRSRDSIRGDHPLVGAISAAVLDGGVGRWFFDPRTPGVAGRIMSRADAPGDWNGGRTASNRRGNHSGLGSTDLG